MVERRSARPHELRRSVSQHSGAACTTGACGGGTRSSTLSSTRNSASPTSRAFARIRTLHRPATCSSSTGRSSTPASGVTWDFLTLAEHLLLPEYAAYPFTAVASPYPHNTAVADMAHRQQALVGYVHPFDVDVDPSAEAPLTNALPVDAALGKSITTRRSGSRTGRRRTRSAMSARLRAAHSRRRRHRRDGELREPARTGGTERVFVPATGTLTREAFLAQVRRAGARPPTRSSSSRWWRETRRYDPTLERSRLAGLQAVLSANFPVDHLEIVWNGEVAASLEPEEIATSPTSPGRCRWTEAAGCCCGRGTTGRTPTCSTSIHGRRPARCTSRLTTPRVALPRAASHFLR